MLNMVRRNTCH